MELKLSVFGVLQYKLYILLFIFILNRIHILK